MRAAQKLASRSGERKASNIRAALPRILRRDRGGVERVAT
jgi:hypothetical protein